MMATVPVLSTISHLLFTTRRLLLHPALTFLISTDIILSSTNSRSCRSISTYKRPFFAYSQSLINQKRRKNSALYISTLTQMNNTTSHSTPIFVDIGANLLDPMFQGSYREKQRHEADLPLVLKRAWDQGLHRIIITGSSLEESKKCLALSHTDPRLFSTVGVHPTRCSQEFGYTDLSWSTYLDAMRSFVLENKKDGKIVAMGEIGLDYCRLEFCDKETQIKGFISQLKIAKEFDLPLFLHNRETGVDLLNILKEHYFDKDDDYTYTRAGVVHSFDDQLDLAKQFIDLGLYIGINGCSLKTKENLDTVKAIPLEHLLLETDCPWCDIRTSHASHEYVTTKFKTKDEKKYESEACVKGRYEPCHIVQVAEVVARLKDTSVSRVASITTKNAFTLFQNLQSSDEIFAMNPKG